MTRRWMTLALAAAMVMVPVVPAAGAPVEIGSVTASVDEIEIEAGASGVLSKTVNLVPCEECSYEITWSSSCQGGISATFDPASKRVDAGSSFTFTETIQVPASIGAGSYTCEDTASADGVDLPSSTTTVIVPEDEGPLPLVCEEPPCTSDPIDLGDGVNITFQYTGTLVAAAQERAQGVDTSCVLITGTEVEVTTGSVIAWDATGNPDDFRSRVVIEPEAGERRAKLWGNPLCFNGDLGVGDPDDGASPYTQAKLCEFSFFPFERTVPEGEKACVLNFYWQRNGNLVYNVLHKGGVDPRGGVWGR